VQTWLAQRSAEFREGIEVVVIDPHAGYAAAVRAVLPRARIAVDHFHLIMLANKTVTALRQRVTRDLLGRPGRKTDPAWANRRLLLRGRERLSPAALARM
jgi:transposase